MNRVLGFIALALSLFGAGPSSAAGGHYDEEDPFRERLRVDRLQQLGWDFSKELTVEFYFGFRDRAETRERHARIFAAKLRRMGYPEASTRPCAREKDCWFVVAPKKLRIDLKKMIALSKELDQLAADDYGRYEGWESEFFNEADQRILSGPAPGQTTPTPAVFLTALEQAFAMQCLKVRDDMEGKAKELEAAGKTYQSYMLRGSRDMMCRCLPDRAREVRAALPPDERDALITEAEFTQRYAMPKLIQPCVAGMMRKMYGDNCTQMATGLPVKAASYCPCMQSVMAELSEAEITQLGLDAANYIPRAAQAQKDGTSPPESPPLYRRFMEKEAACRQ